MFYHDVSDVMCDDIIDVSGTGLIHFPRKYSFLFFMKFRIELRTININLRESCCFHLNYAKRKEGMGKQK